MDLQEKTIKEIEEALHRVGAYNPNARGINLHESYTVKKNKVIFAAELRGMGHNEPASYGTRYTTYTAEELFPDES